MSSQPLAVAEMPGFDLTYVLYNFAGESSAESCVGVSEDYSAFIQNRHTCLSPSDEEARSGSIAFIGRDSHFAWSANVPGEPLSQSIQSTRWAAFQPAPEAAIGPRPARPGVRAADARQRRLGQRRCVLLGAR
jgi:hypothetical protein